MPLFARVGPAVFMIGIMVLFGLVPFFWFRFFGRSRGKKTSPAGLFVALLLALGLITVGVFGVIEHQRAMQPVVERLAWEPVRVDGNMVVVNIRTDVRGSAVELRAGLSGPRLSAAAEEQLAALEQPRPATLVRSGEAGGNQVWRLQPPGSQVWQVGFVFPNAAAAEETFRNLKAMGMGAVPLDHEAGWDIFNTITSDGREHRGRIEVSRVISSGNSNWVTVSGQSAFNESAVNVTWEVLASQPGVARFRREGNSSNPQLQLDPKTKFYRVPISVELTKAGTNRVRLVTKTGGGTFREELPGSFREVAAELRRTAALSAKTVRGASIELCQVSGQPITVQVDGGGVPGIARPESPASAPGRAVLGAPAELQPTDGAPAPGPSTVSFAVPTRTVGARWFAILLGLVVLFILGVGVAVLVVVLRKRNGSTVLKVFAVLVGVGLILLLLVLLLAGGLLFTFGKQASHTTIHPALEEQSPAVLTTTEAAMAASPTGPIPTQIDFKVLRVENPPGTRDIQLHFERDTNYGLGLEVTQDVTVPPDSQPPKEHYRSWEQKTWVGLNGGRVLAWTLPREFTEDEVRAAAREVEKRAKTVTQLSDGSVPEFATVTHRDGWKYHLFARVLREPGSPRPPAPAGALFTAQQAIYLPADARVRVRLAQAGKDGRKTSLDGDVVFKTALDRATGIILRWRAYPAQQGKFGNQWSLDLVDPDTGVVFHRVEHSFAVPVSVTSSDVLPLPSRPAPIQLVDPGSGMFAHLLHATRITAPGAAITDWWDVSAEVTLISPSDGNAVPAFQLPVVTPKPVKAQPQKLSH